jgi:hypothetical protein
MRADSSCGAQCVGDAGAGPKSNESGMSHPTRDIDHDERRRCRRRNSGQRKPGRRRRGDRSAHRHGPRPGAPTDAERQRECEHRDADKRQRSLPAHLESVAEVAQPSPHVGVPHVDRDPVGRRLDDRCCDRHVARWCQRRLVRRPTTGHRDRRSHPGGHAVQPGADTGSLLGSNATVNVPVHREDARSRRAGPRLRRRRLWTSQPRRDSPGDSRVPSFSRGRR